MSVPYARLLLVSNNHQRLAHVVESLNQIDKYELVLTNDLDQAANLIAIKGFDIVIVDVCNEKCAGANFLEKLTGDVPVPLLVFGEAEDLPKITNCIVEGASDYFMLPINSTLLQARIQSNLQKKRLQEQALTSLHAFNEVEKLADDLRLVILPLSVALSAEKDFDRLVERFVVTAMDLCNADAGTLFMRTSDDELRYAIARVKSLGLVSGGTTGNPVPYSNLPLYDAEGQPVLENVATFAAHEGISINIADINDKSSFDFSGTQRFDQENNYYSVSCLTVPLINHEVTGVLQLRNAQDPETGQIVSFGPYQQLVAESLASQAAVALHNRRLRKREAALLHYKRELQIGREIQAGFFPATLPQPPGWQLTARFQPAQEVAGDFYDAFMAPMGKVGLIIADVCDKGIVAALFMALLRSLLRAFILQHYSLKTDLSRKEVEDSAEYYGSWYQRRPFWPRPFYPSDKAALVDAIRLTNAYIGSNHANTHIFATLFVGILDPLSGQMIYVNSGHLPPLLIRENKEIIRLMPTGPAVGLLPDAQFKVRETVLNSGDTLLAYTDGISEARDGQGNLFGQQRLINLIHEAGDASVSQIANDIESAVQEYTQSETPYDDMALLILRRNPDFQI